MYYIPETQITYMTFFTVMYVKDFTIKIKCWSFSYELAYRGSWHFVTSGICVCLLENFAFVSSLFKFGGWRLLLTHFNYYIYMYTIKYDFKNDNKTNRKLAYQLLDKWGIRLQIACQLVKHKNMEHKICLKKILHCLMEKLIKLQLLKCSMLFNNPFELIQGGCKSDKWRECILKL